MLLQEMWWDIPPVHVEPGEVVFGEDPSKLEAKSKNMIKMTKKKMP